MAPRDPTLGPAARAGDDQSAHAMPNASSTFAAWSAVGLTPPVKPLMSPMSFCRSAAKTAT
jgi:hypothetical protein